MPDLPRRPALSLMPWRWARGALPGAGAGTPQAGLCTGGDGIRSSSEDGPRPCSTRAPSSLSLHAKPPGQQQGRACAQAPRAVRAPAGVHHVAGVSMIMPHPSPPLGDATCCWLRSTKAPFPDCNAGSNSAFGSLTCDRQAAIATQLQRRNSNSASLMPHSALLLPC